MTQTQLCKLTGIKKSLMNRIVKSLEQKQLIEYVKTDNDRRITPIRFNVEKEEVFMQEHNNSIEIVKQIVDILEMERAKNVLQSLKDVNAGAKSVFGIK